MTTNRIDATNQIQTAETDTTKVLAPDGAGGVEWAAGGGGASIDVTDGSTTVTAVTSIDFTSGATVTDGGGGVAEVAVTASGSLEVKEADGTPDVTGVSLIIVSNGTLTDNGGGSVSITTGGGGGGGLAQSYVGYNTAGGSQAAFASDTTTAYVKKIACTAGDIVLSIGAYVDMHNQAGFTWAVGIWADSGGSPTSVLATGSFQTTSGGLYLGTATDTPQWLDTPCSYVIPSSGDYWFGFYGTYQATNWRIYYDGSGGDGIITSGTSPYIMPVGAGASFASGTNKYSIRVSILS